MYDAEAVLFDPDLDVAVLHVPGLRGPSLRFATGSPRTRYARRDPGIRGRRPARRPARRRVRRVPATGRDIYGSVRVTRDILELRAAVEPGDSGGPLVLEDGTVGGVVFAESKTDPEVGYALTPTSVATRVQPAIGRTGHVDVGPCIR